MRHRSTSILITLLSTAVLALTFAAPASASTRVEYSPTYTLGSNILCGATIKTAAVSHPAAPGRVSVFLTADFVIPVRIDPNWACDVAAIVHWRNEKTGAVGSRTVGLSYGNFARVHGDQPCVPLVTPTTYLNLCGRSATLRLTPGRGWIRSWVTTRSTSSHGVATPHISGSARINAF